MSCGGPAAGMRWSRCASAAGGASPRSSSGASVRLGSRRAGAQPARAGSEELNAVSEVTVSVREPAWQSGAQASEALGPEMGLLARLDPADFGASVLAALTRAAGRPAEAGRAWLRFGSAMALAGPAAVARWAGAGTPPPVPDEEKDRRFADPAWDG